MFSSISHEFRTPLNAFINAIELLKLNAQSLDTLKTPENLAKINRLRNNFDKNIRMASISSKVLQSLTEDILDFAKIEAGMFSLNESPFLVNTLIEDLTYIFEYQCQQKRISLIFDCPSEVRNCSFNSDMDRIKQVLMNLVSNAFKFTNEGSITISLKTETTRVKREVSRFLKIKVTDTGIGIRREEQTGLFKVFGMVKSTRENFNMKGTGLGLTICQKLVNSMGGEIDLRSNEGVGTQVTFSVKENKGYNNLEESKENHLQIPRAMGESSDR